MNRIPIQDRLKRAVRVCVTEEEYKKLIVHSFNLGLSAWGREAIRREVFDPIPRRLFKDSDEKRTHTVIVFLTTPDYIKALEKVQDAMAVSISSWGRSVLLSQYEYDLEQMAKLDDEA